MNTINAGPEPGTGTTSRVDTPAARWRLSGLAEELHAVRRIVAEGCAWLAVPAELTDAAVLAVDELATNAQIFGPYELRLYTDPPGWGVADRCPAGIDRVAGLLAGGQGIPSMDEDGRGLLIVATLFPEHRVRPTILPPDHPGKEVRFALPHDARP